MGEVASGRWFETVGFTPIAHQLLVLLASKRGNGYSDVFSSTYHETWQLSKQYDYTAPAGIANMSANCPMWKRMRPSSGRETAIKVSIDESVFDVAIAQGPLTQIVSLLSDIGGYMSLMTALFVAVWVRRNPHGKVAEAYEERTLFGFAESLQDAEQGLIATADYSTRGLAAQPPSNAIGVSQGLGNESTCTQLPAGYSQTE